MCTDFGGGYGIVKGMVNLGGVSAVPENVRWTFSGANGRSPGSVERFKRYT